MVLCVDSLSASVTAKPSSAHGICFSSLSTALNVLAISSAVIAQYCSIKFSFSSWHIASESKRRLDGSAWSVQPTGAAGTLAHRLLDDVVQDVRSAKQAVSTRLCNSCESHCENVGIEKRS